MLLLIPGNHLVKWQSNWPPWLLFCTPSLLKNSVCVFDRREEPGETRQMRWQVLSSVLLYKGVKGSCVPPC